MALSKLTVTQNFPVSAQHQATSDNENVSFTNPGGPVCYIITTMTNAQPSNDDMKYGLKVGDDRDDEDAKEERSLTLNNGEYVWIAHGVGGTSITIGMHS